MERRRTSEQHARCTYSHCTACSEVEMDHIVFLPFFAGTQINLLELESLISLTRHVTREGIRAKTALDTCRFARGLGSRLNRTIELTKNYFLASQTEVFGVSLMTFQSWYGCLPGPFTEQADRKLVRLFAKASLYTDRNVGIGSRSRGVGSPP